MKSQWTNVQGQYLVISRRIHTIGNWKGWNSHWVQLVILICHADQQKTAWFERNFCESCFICRYNIDNRWLTPFFLPKIYLKLTVFFLEYLHHKTPDINIYIYIYEHVLKRNEKDSCKKDYQDSTTKARKSKSCPSISIWIFEIISQNCVEIK